MCLRNQWDMTQVLGPYTQVGYKKEALWTPWLQLNPVLTVVVLWGGGPRDVTGSQQSKCICATYSRHLLCFRPCATVRHESSMAGFDTTELKKRFQPTELIHLPFSQNHKSRVCSSTRNDVDEVVTRSYW